MMAILWSRTLDGKKYEVRTAGKTRRLYTDGVFHSQYHPARLFAGSIWDMLWMPALFYEPGKLKRILLLGVGGGAVIHLLHRYAEPDIIDAIDINPVHLHVARRYFNIDRSSANLLEADGINWLRDYSGPPYDMIIDDMYGEEDGEPARAVELDEHWLQTIRDNLTPDGVMVLNALSNRELTRAACFTDTGLSRDFESAWQLTEPAFYNAIGAVFRRATDIRAYRRRINEHTHLKNLDIRLRRLK